MKLSTAQMRGDEVARLYRRWRPAVYSRARKVLRDEMEAEDVTQEVFIRVLRHLDRLPETEAELAWIHRICTNYCLNELRRRRSHSRELGPVDDTFASPEVSLIPRNFTEKALSTAPAKVAATARLYFVDGLEQHTVAKREHVSRRTVCTRLEQFVEHAHDLKRQEDERVERHVLSWEQGAQEGSAL